MVEERNKEETDEMIAVPAYIDVSPADIERVSVIAASLAAEHYPESRFVIKNKATKSRNGFGFVNCYGCGSRSSSP